MAAGTVTYRYPTAAEPTANQGKNEVVADVAMGAGANDAISPRASKSPDPTASSGNPG